MILKASQRSGATQLGLHLLKTEENEHVEVYEVRGFMSETVMGAMKEAQAMAKGTRCKQYLFSVSLNPPETENVAVEVLKVRLPQSRISSACKASRVWWSSMKRKAAAMPMPSGRGSMPRR